MVRLSDVCEVWESRAKPILLRLAKEEKVPKSTMEIIAKTDIGGIFRYVGGHFPENESPNIINVCGLKYPTQFITNDKYAYTEAIAYLFIRYIEDETIKRDYVMAYGFTPNYFRNVFNHHIYEAAHNRKNLFMKEFHKKLLTPCKKISFKIKESFYWIYSTFLTIQIFKK